MKKVLLIALVFVMLFSFCCCGVAQRMEAAQNGDGNANAGANTVQGSPYVGTWEKSNTADLPFSMTMVLKKDGTGTHGKSTPVTWKEIEGDKIEIVMHFEYGDPSTTTAYLTDNGKLCWEHTFKVQKQDGSMMEVNEVIFTKK